MAAIHAIHAQPARRSNQGWSNQQTCRVMLCIDHEPGLLERLQRDVNQQGADGLDRWDAAERLEAIWHQQVEGMTGWPVLVLLDEIEDVNWVEVADALHDRGQRRACA